MLWGLLKMLLELTLQFYGQTFHQIPYFEIFVIQSPICSSSLCCCPLYPITNQPTFSIFYVLCVSSSCLFIFLQVFLSRSFFTSSFSFLFIKYTFSYASLRYFCTLDTDNPNQVTMQMIQNFPAGGMLPPFSFIAQYFRAQLNPIHSFFISLPLSYFLTFLVDKKTIIPAKQRNLNCFNLEKNLKILKGEDNRYKHKTQANVKGQSLL